LGCVCDVAYLAEKGGAQIGLGLADGSFGEEGSHLDVLEHNVGAGLAGEHMRFDT
jgi:hypothetical protein